MAKKTYLELTNQILRMIPLATITDVTTALGHTKTVVDSINDAQNHLSNEEEWYSLYKTRLFTTVTYTASTISFAASSPAVISDSASGFGSFSDGMEVLVGGSTSNDKIVTIATAADGSLTLQTSDTLTAEALGESITISAMSYPQASDYSRTLDMMDETNNTVVSEDFTRAMDWAYPQSTFKGQPTNYSIIGSQFRFYPIPAGDYNLRERYWKFPTTLAVNGDQSDLPIESENALMWFATYITFLSMGKMEQADRAAAQHRIFMASAKVANNKKIDRMRQIKSGGQPDSNRFPTLPQQYGRRR